MLRRLTWLVGAVRVSFTGAGEAARGVAKQCRIVVRPVVGRATVVTATARDWRTAFDAAVKRLAGSLIRSWRAKLRQQRAQLPAPAPR